MKNSAKDLTELVFILDRSGSMAGLEHDTIGGFNSMLEKQKRTEGDAVVTTVLFDSTCELLHDRTDLRGIAPMTDKEYTVGGCTALLDAIGQTIDKITRARQHVLFECRPQKTLFVIITDGEENASREYSADHIRKLIGHQKEEGWEFVFLGANIDAITAASRIGITPSRAADYHADSVGTRTNFDALSELVSTVRSCAPRATAAALDDGCWKAGIEEDYRTRK